MTLASSHGTEDQVTSGAIRSEPPALTKVDPIWLLPVDARSNASSRPYAPYAIDWRFLPEEVLLLKDFARHHIVRLNEAAATSRPFSGLWAATVGQRTIRSVVAAKTLFIHIPKTGGTSVSQLLYGRNLPHFTARFYFDTFKPAVSSLPSFSVVRHPVERLLSAYRFAVHGGSDIMAFSRYDRIRLGCLDSFESLVDFLDDHRDRLSAAPTIFQDQAGFIVDDGGRILVDHLFSLDDRFGLPADLCHFLGVERIPHLNISKSKAVPLLRTIKSKIEKIYARDVELYDHLASKGGHIEMKDAWPGVT